MPDLFNTSVTSLLAFQRSLVTTGHNIANANTEGYSRQRVDLLSRPPQAFGNGFVGRGVFVNNIERITDQFLNLQLQQTTSENSRLGAFHTMSSRIDNLISDGQSGIAPSLQDFFNSIQDLADNPTSASTRQVALSKSQSLIERFDFVDQQLDDQNSEVNSRLSALTNTINSLANNIAEVNNDIILATGQAGGSVPNDLYDQRDKLVNNLSELVSVTTLKEDSGALSVFIGNGQNLVIGVNSRTLITVQDPSNFTQSQIAYQTGTGSVIIGDQLNGGEIGGLLDFRREMLAPTRNELGRIATVLADTFNTQHREGQDLNGALGTDFFNIPTPLLVANLNNTGTATATATITDSTALTTSDYQLTYDGAAYTLTRLSDNNSVTGAGPLSMDGFDVAITAGAVAGDSFLVRPTFAAAGGLTLAINNVNQIAAASPVRTESLNANLGDAEIKFGQILDITDTDLLDRVEIVFNNPPTTFDVFNITDASTIASGVAYTSGNDIDFNGIRVSITGAPVAGDTFRTEENVGGISDNRNALSLSDLQTQNFIGGAASYQTGFGSLVGRVGTLTGQAQINGVSQLRLLEQAQQDRDAVSGVNLDEEAVNLTKFQQAYEASARVLSVADTLFGTLLSAIGR